MDFCTLAMFIIDEITFEDERPSVNGIIGGAGSYAALGARIFSHPPQSKAVGWIVDCGSDFSDSFRESIQKWQTSCLFRETPDRLTTRASNFYGPDEYRGFQYLTPKIRLEASDLTPELLRAKSFHLVCSPARLIEQVRGIKTRLQIEANGESLPDPIIVWEPVPDLCTPEELANCMEAAKLVNVISPNNQELAMMFQNPHRLEDGYQEEQYSKSFLASGIGKDGKGTIVVRCGSKGCYLASRTHTQWIPAFHKLGSNKVKDPTGGGNTFLGGLAVGLARGKSMEEACIWASVAASFAIEQIGMPAVTNEADGEKWNGDNAWKRVEELKSILV